MESGQIIQGVIPGTLLRSESIWQEKARTDNYLTALDRALGNYLILGRPILIRFPYFRLSLFGSKEKDHGHSAYISAKFCAECDDRDRP